MSATAIAQFYQLLSPQERREAQGYLAQIDQRSPPQPVKKYASDADFIAAPENLERRIQICATPGATIQDMLKYRNAAA